MSVVSNFIELADGGGSADVLFNLPFLVLHCVMLANSASSQLNFPSFWNGEGPQSLEFSCFVLFWFGYFVVGFFICFDFKSPQFAVPCEHLAKHWKVKVFEKINVYPSLNIRFIYPLYLCNDCLQRLARKQNKIKQK